MAKNDNLKDFLTDVANAIREKKGTTEPINPQDFSAEIAAIQSGGGEGGGGTTPEHNVPLYIEALEPIIISFANTHEYSKNNDTWSSGTSETPVSASAGDKVYYRASGLTATSSAGIGAFTISGKCNVGGNIMSMLYGTDYKGKESFIQEYSFYKLFTSQPIVSVKRLSLPATTLTKSCYAAMFHKCSNLVDAPELPATSTIYGCYSSMFKDCTSLVSAPRLPSLDVARISYAYMFSGCSNLETAPDLPALTVNASSYQEMFKNCTNLVNAPGVLPALILYSQTYKDMFYGCTKLTRAPYIEATTTAYYSCANMFYGCTSLVTAPPILPATTLGEVCYSNMFFGCTSLVAAPVLPAITLTNGCYDSMFSGCTSLVSVQSILPATTLIGYCYRNMFSGCTSLVTAPVLPARTLTYKNAVENYGSYHRMFKGCSKLRYVKALFSTTPGANYTKEWLDGVPSSGTFVKYSGASWSVSGVNGIPSGWTTQTASE